MYVFIELEGIDILLAFKSVNIFRTYFFIKKVCERFFFLFFSYMFPLIRFLCLIKLMIRSSNKAYT